MSHVVLSCTPTLKLLHHSLNTRKTHRHIDKILVVTMPTTKSCAGAYHDPVNADNEVSAIKSRIASPDSIEILSNPEPCHVLERLPECSMVHFACHGQAHPMNPSQSALLLGKDDLAELTVANIGPLSLDSAQIAYLSACSTAKLGGENVTHEVVHLASTFQLASFQDVIGTMWSIDDTLAGRLAAKFYHFLLGQSPGATQQMSRALHQATKDLKEKLREENTDDDANIFQWASFIHFGPSSVFVHK